ncbi:MAG: glycosyltransferase family 2 protein [Prevotella sp.]|nr:glycosyltransferase family 2 protein [Prevotella sp.]
MNISVILTCFNRKAKTLRCLDCLFEAQDDYNRRHNSSLSLAVYLTDDGCTDGTPIAVTERFVGHDITIIPGNGQLYWAGGMRKAWRAAMARHAGIDFYLLANDDTFAFLSLFDELLDTHHYCLERNGLPGIYSGVTCDESHPEIITYSGDCFDRQGRLHRLAPTGTPQLVDITNANMLLVHKTVVDRIGIFYEGYRHGGADNDYALTARRHGLPAYITAQVCGTCPYDHPSLVDEMSKLMAMNLNQRRAYLSHPLHSDAEYLLLMKRNFPSKYPLTWALRKMRLYFPKLYLAICKARGIQ